MAWMRSSAIGVRRVIIGSSSTSSTSSSSGVSSMGGVRVGDMDLALARRPPKSAGILVTRPGEVGRYGELLARCQVRRRRSVTGEDVERQAEQAGVVIAYHARPPGHTSRRGGLEARDSANELEGILSPLHAIDARTRARDDHALAFELDWIRRACAVDADQVQGTFLRRPATWIELSHWNAS